LPPPERLKDWNACVLKSERLGGVIKHYRRRAACANHRQTGPIQSDGITVADGRWLQRIVTDPFWTSSIESYPRILPTIIA
jgi:hypothetical protein